MLAAIAPMARTVAAEAPAKEIAAQDAPQIKVQPGAIVIEVTADTPAHVAIYALTGQVIKQFDAAPGQTVVDLPAGYYLVRVGHSTVKVAVK